MRQVPVVGKAAEEAPSRSWSFITSRGRYHMVKIVGRANDIDQTAAATAILGYPEHYRGVIEFENFRFVTTRPLVAAYLDDAIRHGLKGVSRDAEEILIRCSLCDELFTNTKAGQANLSDHMLEAHPPIDMPSIPQSIGNYLSPAQVNAKVTAGMVRQDEQEADERFRERGTLNEDLDEFLGDDEDGYLSAGQVEAIITRGPNDFHFAGQPVTLTPDASVEAEDAGNEVPERERAAGDDGRSGGSHPARARGNKGNPARRGGDNSNLGGAHQ